MEQTASAATGVVMSGTKSAALFSALIAVAACSESEEPARPSALLTDETTQNIISATDIQSINGTYTNCTNRSGSWSFAVTGSPTLTNASLSVIRGDTDCALAITQVITGANGSLNASAPLVLSTTFGPARSFGSPIRFYATAAVGSVNFSGDFSISLLFSEDPRNASEGLTAAFATVTGSSASAVGVPAPNYTLDVTGAVVTTDIAGVTVAILGNVVLTAGSATGDSYVIVNGAVADTYGAINTSFTGGTPTALTLNIAASSLLAPGVSIATPVVRTLIIAKITSGVASYQKFAVTFSPPA